MKITLAPLENTRDEENIRKFYSTLERMKHEDTDIIMFPEYFPIWPFLADLSIKPLLKNREKEVREKAKQFAEENDKMVVYGCLRKELYNSLIVALPSGKEKIYNKRIRHGIERTLKRGKKDLILDYKGYKIGFLVCYEMLFPEAVRNLAFKDIDLLLGISWIPEVITDYWAQILKVRSFCRLQCVLITAEEKNMAGLQ